MFRFVLVLCLVPFLSVWGRSAEQQHICRYCDGGHFQLPIEHGDLTPHARKYAPARYIDLLNLKLDVTPDFDERTVTGTATLEFAPIAKPLKKLTLNAVDLEVSAVRGSVAIADWSVSREEITVVFAESLAAGERYVLEIDYSAEPREGLYFRTAEMGYPAEDTHLFTQGEPQLGRHWFPSHDYPNERSSTEIICHVPSAMTVLSNGKLIRETARGDGMKSVHWRQETPHVCYLITLVAGYFEKIEDLDRDVPLAFYTQPTVAEHAANSFRDTADIMQFYNHEIGVPFPWNKYFQVTAMDFRFGGMENTSMTTLANRTIFTEATENIRNGRVLDAHEMAHQWFGDLVTCKDWSHLWLNESFATYYSHLYEGHKFGHDALAYAMYRDANEKVLPRHKDRRPIVYNRYDDPIEQFDFRAYPKGSWVLHMLRSQLGEPLYRDVVRTYLERNALTSVTTPDFVKVVEELSGRAFDQYFDQWIYHGGHPNLKIKYKWLAEKKLARVTIEQTQEVDDEVLLFEFPTLLRFTVDGQAVDHPIEITEKKQEFYVSLAAQPTTVRFDPEYTLLAEVEFDKSDKLLLAQLENQDDMIGRLLAVRALAERETKKSLAAVGRALREDPFFGVRVEAARALGEVEKDEALAELRQSMAGDARVRLAVVEAIGKFYSSDAEQALLQVIEAEQNPAIVAEATRALGKYRTPQSQAVVTRQLASQSFRNELAVAAMEAIGKLREPALRGALIQTLVDRGAEFNSSGLGTGLKQLATISHDLDDEEHRGEVERFLRAYLNHPQRQVRIAAIEALGTLGDSRSQAVLEALTTPKPRDSVAKAAAKALKKLRSEAPLAPQELTELRDELFDLKDITVKLREELETLKSQQEAGK